MYEQESQRLHHIFMQQTLIDDRYALSNLLGSGSMAKVYLAHDDILDRDVALKVLRDQYVNTRSSPNALGVRLKAPPLSTTPT